MSEATDTYQYYGGIHIHTKHSDGTGNVNSISKAAKKAGLDWIIITDHNYYDSEEGIFNDVYVIKGEEISPEGHDHYLVLDINKQIEPAENAQINADNVRKSGGFGFAAHPDESSERKNKWSPIFWTDKNIIPDGIEIWNWFSNWGDNLNDRNLFNLAYSYFLKHNIITVPSEKTMEWWDKLNRTSERIVPAIGGVDAHALKIYKYILPLTVFPYKECFETITNAIWLKERLSEDFLTAKKQILSAVKSGENIILNRKVCNETPLIYIQNSGNKAYCGQSIQLTSDTNLIIGTNAYVDATIVNDGKKIAKITTKDIIIPIKETGNYRLEFSYKGKPFCYTNPIRVI